MNELQASVLIPTHDHGPLVGIAIESALAQTLDSLEVLVVGDGAPHLTRELVGEISTRDRRVRYFDNPKGPRHGEIHRHAALAEARGRTVLYLADDDLWLPEHAETMLALLEGADFACSTYLRVHPDGGFDLRPADLTADQRGPPVPLSCAAHTLVAYRNLPFGWRTTPPSIPTDRYMWAQFLAQGDCRAVASDRVTVLHLPSPKRRHMTPAERVEELGGWWQRIRDPAARANLYSTLLHTVSRELVRSKATQARLKHKLNQGRKRLDELEQRLGNPSGR